MEETGSRPPAQPRPPVIRIGGRRPPGSLRIPRELWQYRELLFVLAGRDIRLRYKQTLLGATWAVLQPALAAAIFTVVFGRFARLPSDGVAYLQFVFSGLVGWMFFANAVSSAAGSIVATPDLVNKVYFPRLLVPFGAMGGAVVDLIAALPVLGVVILLGPTPLRPTAVLLPAVFLGLLVTAAGVGALLAALNVSYRDLRHALPFLLQAWLFATPVVYPASMLGPGWRAALFLNPVAGYIEGIRAALFGLPVDVRHLATSLGATAVLFVAGVVVFRRMERRFADVI